ncbi:MAG: hypothetical protein WDO68_07375 [Gammaproteobacteria bacterium]
MVHVPEPDLALGFAVALAVLELRLAFRRRGGRGFLAGIAAERHLEHRGEAGLLIHHQLVAALGTRNHVGDQHQAAIFHRAVARLDRLAAALRQLELAAGAEVVFQRRAVIRHDLELLARQHIRQGGFAGGAAGRGLQRLGHLSFGQVRVGNPMHLQRAIVTC